MSLHREDYEAKARETLASVNAWGHTHTFLAGLLIGALAGLIAGAFL